MGKKNQEQTYRVKDILEYKVENGQEYFLVWWVGYPKRQATWEPMANVQDLYDFQVYYKKLKQKYLQRLNQSQSYEQSRQESLVKQPSSHHSKTKKINKLKKGLKNGKESNKQHLKQPQQLPIVDYLIDPPKQVPLQPQPQPQPQTSPAPQQKVIELIGVDPRQQAKIIKQLRQSPAVKFQIKIKQFNLPFRGQKLKEIKSSFVRGDKMMYQIQLQNKAFTQPIILHQNYIKILWPRQFAQYLISKAKP